MLLEAENVSPLLLQILNDFLGLIYSEGDLFIFYCICYMYFTSEINSI